MLLGLLSTPAAQVFFQRLNDSDGTEAVAADENSLGALGRMRADPFIELARLNGLLVRGQTGGSVVNHLEALTLKVASALLVHFSREPRRTESARAF